MGLCSGRRVRSQLLPNANISLLWARQKLQGVSSRSPARPHGQWGPRPTGIITCCLPGFSLAGNWIRNGAKTHTHTFWYGCNGPNCKAKCLLPILTHVCTKINLGNCSHELFQVPSYLCSRQGIYNIVSPIPSLISWLLISFTWL